MELDHRDKVDKNPLGAVFEETGSRRSGRTPLDPVFGRPNSRGSGRDPLDRRQRKKGEASGSRVRGRWKMPADGSIPFEGVFLRGGRE